MFNQTCSGLQFVAFCILFSVLMLLVLIASITTTELLTLIEENESKYNKCRITPKAIRYTSMVYIASMVLFICDVNFSMIITKEAN